MAEAAADQGDKPKKPRVRKQKKGHGGHHGGAWKVAYADFITTMMALFLLLWLLNASDSKTKAQLAQYFRDPGIFKTRQSSKIMDDMESSAMPSKNSAALPSKDKQKKKGDEKKQTTTAEDDVRIDTLTAKMNTVLRTGDGHLEGYINVTRTPTGLRITALNGPDNKMFARDSAKPTKALEKFLTEIGEGLALIREARMTVRGHTDASPVSRPDGYGNFDLSTDRALAVKRILQRSGVPEQRFIAIEGLGATVPSVPDPLDPRNQRVTIDVEWAIDRAD